MLKILLIHFKSSIALDVSFLTETIPIEPCSLRKLLTIGYCFLLSPNKIVMLRSIVLLTPFHHIVFFSLSSSLVNELSIFCYTIVRSRSKS